MVIINDKQYDNVVQDISYGNYSVRQDGERREGIAPCIFFQCDDDVYIGVETLYDIKWIKELELNTMIDITKYISDITYEDKSGWMSLVVGEHSCLLSRIGDNEVYIDLKYKGEEFGSYLDISIKENVKLNYEELSE